MPLDSVAVSALSQELRGRIVGGKIDKVQQPERDTVLLTVRGGGENCRLAVCGGVGNARVHITDSAFETRSSRRCSVCFCVSILLARASPR